MSLDCEYNQNQNDKTTQGEVIQIGAVVYNCVSGDIIDTINLNVRIEDPIYPFITELTGITTEYNQKGMPLLEAYSLLKDFHAKHPLFIMTPLLWGTGVVSDSHEIYRQVCRLSPNLDNFMGRRSLDLKTLVQLKVLAKGGAKSGGLKTVIQRNELKWDYTHGAPHDAVADAFNTALLHIKLNKDIFGA